METREQKRLRLRNWWWWKTKSSTNWLVFHLILWLLQCKFHFILLNHKPNQKRIRKKTRTRWESTPTRNTVRKHICGCISIEYITQINAINISRIENYNRVVIYTHTLNALLHTKWFDISFMCMIWCFASICITSRRRRRRRLLLSFYSDLIECTFNWIWNVFSSLISDCFFYIFSLGEINQCQNETGRSEQSNKRL